MPTKFFLILTMLFLYSVPTLAQDMSIDEAYRAIPHKQTPYSMKQSRLPTADAKYLDHFFFAANMGIRAKVMTLRSFYGQTKSMDTKTYNQEINGIISSFSLIQTPRHLRNIEKTFISALRDQQSFFNEWDSAKNTPQYQNLKKNYRRHPTVLKAHQKFTQIYARLKQIYPSEISQNQKAFYDHLCALDFI